MEDRPVVEKTLADIAAHQGYQLQKSAGAFAGRKTYLRYQSMMGPSDRIEVDINFLHRVPIEVLRLGLEGTNARISIAPLVATQINAGIEALLPDSGKVGNRRKEDDHAQIREIFPLH